MPAQIQLESVNFKSRNDFRLPFEWPTIDIVVVLIVVCNVIRRILVGYVKDRKYYIFPNFFFTDIRNKHAAKMGSRKLSLRL